ncbi:hypothetical protein [Streptomyces sp. NPDC015345]
MEHLAQDSQGGDEARLVVREMEPYGPMLCQQGIPDLFRSRSA